MHSQQPAAPPPGPPALGAALGEASGGADRDAAAAPNAFLRQLADTMTAKGVNVNGLVQS